MPRSSPRAKRVLRKRGSGSPRKKSPKKKSPTKKRRSSSGRRRAMVTRGYHHRSLSSRRYRAGNVTVEELQNWIDTFKGDHANPELLKQNIFEFMTKDNVPDKVLVGNQTSSPTDADLKGIQSSVAMFLHEGVEQGELDFDPWNELSNNSNNIQKARMYIMSKISRITPTAVEDEM